MDSTIEKIAKEFVKEINEAHMQADGNYQEYLIMTKLEENNLDEDYYDKVVEKIGKLL